MCVGRAAVDVLRGESDIRSGGRGIAFLLSMAAVMELKSMTRTGNACCMHS